jgi:hypothetical protein
MGVQYQAALVKPPVFRSLKADGSPETVSTVAYYTCVTTAKCNEVPVDFHGKYVRLTAIGANMNWVFTDKSSHTVDRTIAATDAGARAEGLGGFLASSAVTHVRVPSPLLDPATGLIGKVYFSRQGDAAGSVYMELASD